MGGIEGTRGGAGKSVIDPPGGSAGVNVGTKGGNTGEGGDHGGAGGDAKRYTGRETLAIDV